MKLKNRTVGCRALFIGFCAIIVCFLDIKVSGQTCVPPPAGLLSWWQGNGSAIDQEGTNDGVLLNGAGFGPGEVGQAFMLANNLAGVDVGFAPNLQLQNFTIEAWIKRGSTSFGTLDPEPGDVGEAAIFSYGYDSYGFFLDNANKLLLTQIGVGGSESTTTITDTSFHHVAVTKTNTLITFYVDGAYAGSDPDNNEVYSFNSHVDIGAIGGSQGCSFYGSIDELAFYNRALSADEIQGIYDAGSAGKCTTLVIITQPTNEIGVIGGSTTFSVTAFGSPPLGYQWLFNSQSLPNDTNSLLTITNLQSTNAGTYSVLVSDPSGRLLSSNAVLTLVTPVSITSPPTNITAVLGGSANFSVVADGTPPLYYQWIFDGANILNATNSSYIVNDIDVTNLGTYSVLVSNPGSSATASAVLAFNPQITINGKLGNTFTFTNVSSVEAQISSTFTNAAIFYTLDGSTPSFGSTPYSAPFAITQSAILQAIAYDQDFNSSLSYTVNIMLLRTNTLTIVNPGGGTVVLNPPGGVYLNTQTIQATATPTNHWKFLQWSGDVSSTNPIINVPMTSNQTIMAVFGTPVTFSPPQNGSFQLNPSQPAFPYGSFVEISALPAPGYFFALWGGFASGAANPYLLTVTNPNPNIAALFSALPQGKFSLVLIPNGNGLVSVNPPGNSFASNASVSITATPTGTNKFYFWTGDVISSNSPLNNLAITSNIVATANFSGGKYLIQFSPPQISSNDIQFNLTGVPFQTYDIDVSSNLLDWTLLTTGTNTDGSIPVSDAISNSTQKFYRAIPH